MLAPQILNFSNGEFVATDQWFDKRSPVSSAVIGQVAKPARRRWMPPWRFFKVADSSTKCNVIKPSWAKSA